MKMNREQLKDHFRRAAIKEIVYWSLGHYAGDRVVIADRDRLYFSSDCYEYLVKEFGVSYE